MSDPSSWAIDPVFGVAATNALTAEQRQEALSAVLRHAATGAITVDHHTIELRGIEDTWQRQARGELGSRVVLAPDSSA